jgi:predicted dehydrogenase
VQQSLEHAHAAADAGKQIHLDKPAGIDLPVFKSLLDKMTEKKLLLQMGYMYRYNAGFSLARRAAAEGWLGSVYRVSGCIDTDYTPDKRDKLAGRPGGLMFELGCHLLDITMLMLGVPKKVTPVLRHDTNEADALADNTLAVFEFDKAVAVIESSAMRANAFPTRRFEVIGTNGSIVIEPHEPPAVTINLREPRGGYKRGVQKVTVEDNARHVRDFEDLARCMRGEAEFEYSKQHDYEVQRTLLQACGVKTADA